MPTKALAALLLEACLNQDIYLIEACTLVAVCVAVVTQTLADVGYTYLNRGFALRLRCTTLSSQNLPCIVCTSSWS